MAGKKLAVAAGAGFESRVWDAVKKLIRESGSLFFAEGAGLTLLKSQAAHSDSRRGFLYRTGSSEPVGFICSQWDMYNFMSEKMAGPTSTNTQKRMVKKRLMSVLSKNLKPDLAFFDFDKETLFIVEMKTQSSEGSVDEKLETVHFKRRQYKTLALQIGYANVEFSWALDSKFGEKKYDDVRKYLCEMGSHFEVGAVSLDLIGFSPAVTK